MASHCRFHVLAVAALALAALACSGGPKQPSSQERQLAARPALDQLKAGQLAEARRLASSVLAGDPGNPGAAATRAIAGYRVAMHQLVDEAMGVLDEADRFDTGFNHPRMRAALDEAGQELARIDRDLAIAGAASDFGMELCIACWEQDWNRSGEVDDRDRLLFQIEIDVQGQPIPESDPRRKPTFHFDVGDVYWARAMVSFQRAGIELILAFRWTELDKLFGSFGSSQPPVITIHMEDKSRVGRARDAILAGLQHADQSRTAYLAETDDDREWVPNPGQKSHPLPLPVDAALYATWQGALRDLQHLIAGKEGLGVADLARLGDDRWERENPPGGFIDIGRMLAEPKSIVFDLQALDGLVRSYGADDPAKAIELVLASILGDYYTRDMKPTPLIGRLSRMKREMERGEDTFERKLRYLLWLN